MKSTLYKHGLKPPLKWAGGKRWLVPHLRSLWKPYSQQRLVEPLCGGLAVTLGLMPEKALLNDINTHLINFFRWVQQGLYVEIPLENQEEAYYSHRECFNTLIEEGNENSKEAAELFYYLNRTGYKGLCRFIRKDKFNVPFGRYKKINYIRDYEQYREVFKRWELTCTDFEELSLNNDDFIYADPPYDVEFNSYSKNGFVWEDQVRLVKWLAKHPGPVVLSNQATERIVKLYHKSMASKSATMTHHARSAATVTEPRPKRSWPREESNYGTARYPHRLCSRANDYPFPETGWVFLDNILHVIYLASKGV